MRKRQMKNRNDFFLIYYTSYIKSAFKSLKQFKQI